MAHWHWHWIGVRIHFLYNDEGLVGEYDEAGNEIRTYGWQSGSTWGTDPLFMKQNGEYYYFRNDHLGTPQQMTDKDGVIVWQARYQAFGRAVIDASSMIENNLRFPGQYYDEETGLHYNWHRYYDLATGRYMTPDPIGFKGGKNLFAYVYGNPVNMIDERGLLEYGAGGSIGPYTFSWNSSKPFETQVDFTTDIEAGGGVSICFDNPAFDPCEDEELPFSINVGLGRWTGFSSNGKKICINIGLSISATPLDISIPIKAP